MCDASVDLVVGDGVCVGNGVCCVGDGVCCVGDGVCVGEGEVGVGDVSVKIGVVGDDVSAGVVESGVVGSEFL